MPSVIARVDHKQVNKEGNVFLLRIGNMLFASVAFYIPLAFDSAALPLVDRYAAILVDHRH